ncbi:MAG: DUF192 domain-containing protein [Acidimicrobiia bacterium]
MIHRVVVLALVLAACGEATEPAKTSSTATAATPTSAAYDSANDLADFPRFDMLVADEPWTVAVADTPTRRSRGLMGVTELVGVDGMLFVFVGETFTGPVDVPFTMRNTLMPIDIWFFSYDGKLVDHFTMQPCEEEPCPTYPASGPFAYALETEVGRIDPSGVVEMDFYGFED